MQVSMERPTAVEIRLRGPCSRFLRRENSTRCIFSAHNRRAAMSTLPIRAYGIGAEGNSHPIRSTHDGSSVEVSIRGLDQRGKWPVAVCALEGYESSECLTCGGQ